MIKAWVYSCYWCYSISATQGIQLLTYNKYKRYTWTQIDPSKYKASFISLSRCWKWLSVYSNRSPNTRQQIMLETALLTMSWGSNGRPRMRHEKEENRQQIWLIRILTKALCFWWWFQWLWLWLNNEYSIHNTNLDPLTLFIPYGFIQPFTLRLNRGLKTLLAQSKVLQSHESKPPLLLPHIAISGNQTWG